tara:strand:- start:180 stop:1103 length:924 start_codon:yes stop_codon:yes gene_type:complete
MKILLTGSSGMVGKNILDHFKSSKYKFLTPSRKELNLLDFQSTSKFLKSSKPEMVIHCAGVVGGIEANIRNPVKFLEENSYIGLNLIKAANDNGINLFMNLASSCMYPKNETNPLVEDSILSGYLEPTNEGYALSKIISTKLCEYISNKNPIKKYKTVIPCNLFGKFDNFDDSSSHMIPGVIKKIHLANLKGINKVQIWGDGKSRREFMTASSFADFVFYAIENFNNMPQNINVGLGHDYTINEYYTAIAKTIGYRGKFENDLSKPTGMRQKLVDITKLRSFGWNNKTSLQEGLTETYKYFKENHEL